MPGLERIRGFWEHFFRFVCNPKPPKSESFATQTSEGKERRAIDPLLTEELMQQAQAGCSPAPKNEP